MLASYRNLSIIAGMEVLKTHEFRMCPNAEQREWFARQSGACRFVYNHFLGVRIDYYTEHQDDPKRRLTYHDTVLMQTQLKQQSDHSRLKDGSSQARQHALRDPDGPYHNFFNRQAPFPRLESRRGPQAFPIPRFFRVGRNHLTLPKTGAIGAGRCYAMLVFWVHANARRDFLHKLSRRLVNENLVLDAKGLNVNGMMVNHHRAKRIAGSGWGELFRQLTCTGKWYDMTFYHVGGRLHQDSQLSNRRWRYLECGKYRGPDKNAAFNIVLFSHAQGTGRMPGTHTPGRAGLPAH